MYSYISYFVLIGWYTFDVTDAVKRWINIRKPSKKSKTLSNQLMLEKGKMAVVKKGINNTKLNSVQRDLSLIPDGVFEKASLFVYSEDAKNKVNREKRNAKRKNHRYNRGRNNHRRKGHHNCRRHKQYVDFMEVRHETCDKSKDDRYYFCPGGCTFPFYVIRIFFRLGGMTGL